MTHNFKRIIFSLTIFLSLTITSLLSKGQLVSAKIDFDTTYAFGEIASLPDTIIIFTNYNQLQPTWTYTMLEKIKLDNYNLVYWFEVNSDTLNLSIIDPILYKDTLKIEFLKNDEIVLEFGINKKTYIIYQFGEKQQLFYKLIIKQKE